VTLTIDFGSGSQTVYLPPGASIAESNPPLADLKPGQIFMLNAGTNQHGQEEFEPYIEFSPPLPSFSPVIPEERCVIHPARQLPQAARHAR